MGAGQDDMTWGIRFYFLTDEYLNVMVDAGRKEVFDSQVWIIPSSLRSKAV